YDATIHFFKELLKLLHPFMPFITEELYRTLSDEDKNASIMFAQTETGKIFDDNILNDFEKGKEVIANIRNIRSSKNISLKEKLTLQILGEHNDFFDEIIVKLANVTLETVNEKAEFAVSFMVGTTEYAVPIGNLINTEEEIKKIEADITYYEKFLASVVKKLSNEKFVANAKPEIVEIERKKQSDAQTKLQTLHEGLKKLKS
ncbi:MAG: class I tRNA ligase family protein, partial [Lentimicrobiaceae bacterium]|nr:class I tRNA ligase family protein [Lentimicrobiaceae bacterium]